MIHTRENNVKKKITTWAWWLFRKRPHWPKNTLPQRFDLPPAEFEVSGEARISFVGHSTFLIQIKGINILTDPIWSTSVGPRSVSWSKLTPKRAVQPAIKMEHLPPIDIVLISHNHYDHLDLPTLKQLYRFFPRMRVVVPAGNQLLLGKHLKGCRIISMGRWGERYLDPSGIEIAFEGAKHWSARTLLDQNKTLWGSYYLCPVDQKETDRGGIYFAGDSAYDESLYKAIASRHHVGIALLPIGACKPRALMERVHMNPEDALKAHMALQARYSIAMHFDTFPLAQESFGEIEEECRALLAKTEEGRYQPQFLIPTPGQYFQLSYTI
jgi:L-ascorbate metabolism protein UlaG (beta-lactamase superfamily)